MKIQIFMYTDSVKPNGNFVVRFVRNEANETAIENPKENAVKIIGQGADESIMDVSGMSASIEDDIHATFNAGELDEVGEYVEFTYTVVNELDEIDAVLSFEVTGNESDYFVNYIGTKIDYKTRVNGTNDLEWQIYYIGKVPEKNATKKLDFI